MSVRLLLILFNNNETPDAITLARWSSSLPTGKRKFGDGRVFNHEPEKRELLAINLAHRHNAAAANIAVNCAEQI